MIIGLGMVFLVAPGPKSPSFGRRWSDRLRNGRSTDQPALIVHSQLSGQAISATSSISQSSDRRLPADGRLPGVNFNPPPPGLDGDASRHWVERRGQS
jgi:hypothetical protein